MASRRHTIDTVLRWFLLSFLSFGFFAIGLDCLGGCAGPPAPWVTDRPSAPPTEADEEPPSAPVTRSMTVWMDTVDEEPPTPWIMFRQHFILWSADANQDFNVDLLDVNELVIQMGEKGPKHVYIGADFFLGDRCSPITDVLLVAYEKDPNLPPRFARTDMSGRAIFMDPWPWPWMMDRVELADDE